ncbi:MAG: GNAT family N-acetyltransferase [Adhaeribacter sp.]
MFFREAKSQDIEKMHAIRLADTESHPQDPHLQQPADFHRLLENGKGWVCEVDGDLLGFALADLSQARVEALFVRPGVESDFICRMLHDMMTSWCFARGVPRLLLGSQPPLRAQAFYLKAGWVQTADKRFELENNLEPLGY